MSDRKMYLGDGVYADLEAGMIVLTTEGSLDAPNRICLEPDVFDALLLWVDSIRKEKKPVGRVVCLHRWEEGVRGMRPVCTLCGEIALPEETP